MPILSTLDYVIIAIYLLATVVIGNYYIKDASKNIEHYFLSNRSFPWWLLAFSMAATNFSIDTPLAVTKLVWKNGIQGVWYMWAGGIAAIASVFFFSRLWRRARVMTDNEVIEIRYDGKSAAALRAFKGAYFGILVNCFVLAWVYKAMTKVIVLVTPWDANTSLIVFGCITLMYTASGGLYSVIVTDLMQYVLALAGSIILAVLSVKYVGGMSGLIEKLHALPNGNEYLNMAPSFFGENTVMTVDAFLIFIFVQWWSNKYSDGGGKHIQRMSAAKDENHAVMGTFFYATVTNIVQIWPWIVTALCAMVVFQGAADPESTYPKMMVTVLPSGLLGLGLVSLLSAFMSTVDTHLNLGGSYVINDFYKRFFVKDASKEHYVKVSRVFVILTLVVSIILSKFIDSVANAWQFLMMFSSGAGMVWVLRWFWWRINAYSEFASMIVSGIAATCMKLYYPNMQYTTSLVIVILITLPFFLLATFLTKPTTTEQLQEFYKRVQPGGPGWTKISTSVNLQRSPYLRRAIPEFLLGNITFFCGNFGIGYMIFGSPVLGTCLFAVGAVTFWYLVKRIFSKGAQRADAVELKPLSQKAS